VAFKGKRQAVGRRPRQAGGGHKLGERQRSAVQRVEDDHGLVEHADTAYTAFH
jgi:hypothetical protein